MDIEKYFQINDSKLFFTREQGSHFAKVVAGDFNRIHDTDSNRFCVPGDLLFSVMIHHYGLRQKMGFSFSGMVSDKVVLLLPEVEAREISIYDQNNKKYLDISTSGKTTHNPLLMESLILNCVEFSGYTFPHVLVPLMRDNDAMINPERPLVIYDHMHIELQTLEMDAVVLKHTSSEFHRYGKRADIVLHYDLLCEGEPVGSGQKKVVLSGLQKYNQSKIDHLIASYQKLKDTYKVD